MQSDANIVSWEGSKAGIEIQRKVKKNIEKGYYHEETAIITYGGSYDLRSVRHGSCG
jgi:hypothetical protein